MESRANIPHYQRTARRILGEVRVVVPKSRAQTADKWLIHRLARLQVKRRRSHFVQRLIEFTSRRLHTQRMLLA